LKKKERKMTVKYFQLSSPGTSFDRASAGLSEMEMFSISICFLKEAQIVSFEFFTL
jgi:hypothetical protein